MIFLHIYKYQKNVCTRGDLGVGGGNETERLVMRGACNQRVRLSMCACVAVCVCESVGAFSWPGWLRECSLCACVRVCMCVCVVLLQG